MRWYLAARYSRHPEMREVRAFLEQQGHTVTSRWIDGGHEITDVQDEANRAEYECFASEGWNDVLSAEASIHFTEAGAAGRQRGARHVEYGIALMEHELVIVCGPRENAFHWLTERDAQSGGNSNRTRLLYFDDWAGVRDRLLGVEHVRD